MSKQQAQAKTSEVQNAATPAVDTSDWQEANVNLDGWYQPEKSGVLLGRAIEAVKVQTAYGEQDVVKVRLGRPTPAIQGKGDEAETVQLAAGMVIGVRISMNLTVLLELVDDQCAVEITPKGKKRTSSGRQIWTYGVKWKGERRPLRSARPATQETGPNDTDEGDDGLPF